MLTGSELEKAEEQYSGQIASQSDVLNQLKSCRSIIDSYKKKITDTQNEEEAVRYSILLDEAKKNYKSIRYQDQRCYTEHVSIWRDSFLKYLEEKEHHNPKRGVSMAMDVLLPYEKQRGYPLTFQDMVDGEILRALLKEFRQVPTISSSSKTKYVKMF